MDKLLYGIPIYVLMPVAIALVGIILFVVVRAFNEGREVSFWPPRIGPRTRLDNDKSNLAIPDTQQKVITDRSFAASIPSVDFRANPIAELRFVSGPYHGRGAFLNRRT